MFYFPITKLEFQGVSFLTWFSHDVKQFLQEGKSLKHGWHVNLLVFIGKSWRHGSWSKWFADLKSAIERMISEVSCDTECDTLLY